jgi:hypothetical protein
MLLADLINKKNLAPCIPKLDIDKGAWDRGEKKHVKEDEDKVVKVVRLVVLNNQELIVRVRIVGGRYVDHENHAPQVTEIRFIRIDVLREIWVLVIRIKGESTTSQQSVSHDYCCKKDEIYQYVLISRGQSQQRFSHLCVEQ